MVFFLGAEQMGERGRAIGTVQFVHMRIQMQVYDDGYGVLLAVQLLLPLVFERTR